MSCIFIYYHILHMLDFQDQFFKLIIIHSISNIIKKFITEQAFHLLSQNRADGFNIHIRNRSRYLLRNSFFVFIVSNAVQGTNHVDDALRQFKVRDNYAFFNNMLHAGLNHLRDPFRIFGHLLKFLRIYI